MKKLHISLLVICSSILLLSCAKELGNSTTRLLVPQLPPESYDYEGESNTGEFDFLVNTPHDNQTTNAGATLGRVLFYDQALSISNRISCGSCHQQALSFTDGDALSIGFQNELTERNTPSILNMKFSNAFFWDMSQFSLEDQVVLPIQNHIEMGMEDLDYLSTKLQEKGYYDDLFVEAFGSATVTSERIGKALAQFVRSVESSKSKFDEEREIEFANFTPKELNGMEVFKKVGCNDCHRVLSQDFFIVDGGFFPGDDFGMDFYRGTGDDRANIGLDLVYQDQGVANGMFKVPSLRNLSLTAPYMHDGRFTTIDQVLDHYQFGVKNHPNLDFRMKNGAGVRSFEMTLSEREALKAFLLTLNDNSVISDPKLSDPFIK